MKKVIKYGAVIGGLNGFNDIFQQMKEALKEGWQPLGGISPDPSNNQFIQTVVMYDEDTPKDGARRRNPQTGYEEIYSRNRLEWLKISAD